MNDPRAGRLVRTREIGDVNIVTRHLGLAVRSFAVMAKTTPFSPGGGCSQRPLGPPPWWRIVMMFLGHGSNPSLTVERKSSARNLEASRKRMPHPRHSATRWEPLSTPKRVILRASHLEAVSSLTVVKEIYQLDRTCHLLLAHSYFKGTNENACAKPSFG